MKSKITFTAIALLLGLLNLRAQTSCIDMNGFVNSKNTGGTQEYILTSGSVEKASQTYYYSGPGVITGVRVYGNYTGGSAGVPLRVGVYNVDANGRPVALLSSANDIWWWFDNGIGYINVNFPSGGVSVNNKFAVSVEVRLASPWGNSFRLRYNGDGDGKGQDLASLAGTSTGNNWTSAKNSFALDGDFYVIPNMRHFLTAAFTPDTRCVAANTPVNFTNTSQLSKDSMFNIINWSRYTGTNKIYAWNFGDGSAISNVVNPSHTYTAAGSYNVTLTVTLNGWNNICTDVFTLPVSVGLAASSSNIKNVTCNGGNDGAFTATGSGGKPPYTFSINNTDFQSATLFSGLKAGNYTLIVKDNSGCTNSVNVTVTEPLPILISAATTNANCGGINGAILATATGGVGAMQYKLNAGAYQASPSFTGLGAGVYTVHVKDANNCVNSKQINVNDFGGPLFTIKSHTDVSCNGGNNGSITLGSSGGSGAVQYSINGGVSYQVSGVFNALTAGTYPIMVKDAGGCVDVSEVKVLQPEPIQVSAYSTPTFCFGGSDGIIKVNAVIGGTGNYSYSINGVNFQSGNVFSGLEAGSYTLTVKDALGCTNSVTVVVLEPAAVSITATITPVQCNGEMNGTISTFGTGGTGLYTYSIDGRNFQSTGDFTGLGAGIYTVIVKDGNGCLSSVSKTISEPDAINTSATTTSATCGNNNGGILAAATGGSGSGFQYSIDGVNFNATGLFSNLSSGTYYLMIRDGSGCQKVITATIMDANGPSFVNVSHTNVSCNGENNGTITINLVTGGTGVLQYSINGNDWQTQTVFYGLSAGNYVVSVKDASGCIGIFNVAITQPNAFVMNASVTNLHCYGVNDGSVTISVGGGLGTLAYSLDGIFYQSSNTFGGLYAGFYTAYVRDAAGCKGVKDFEVSQPALVTASVGKLNVTCNGAANGSLMVTASGGKTPYSYSLNGETYQTGNTFSGLSGGSYTVYVKDANNCIITVNATINEPAELMLLAAINNITCSGGNDGVIDITIIGGTKPYYYEWSNRAINEDIFNLKAGMYSVIVRDFNGCTIVKSFTLTQPPSPIIVNGTVTNASASNAANGMIDVTITGGSSPYTYLWSNNATTEDISGLLPGSYTIIATDNKGCASSATFMVGVSTGVKNISVNSSSVVVYPNPANERIYIDAKVADIRQIRLVNMLGAVVFESQPLSMKAEIIASEFNAGVYFIELVIGDKQLTKRVVITR